MLQFRPAEYELIWPAANAKSLEIEQNSYIQMREKKHKQFRSQLV